MIRGTQVHLFHSRRRTECVPTVPRKTRTTRSPPHSLKTNIHSQMIGGALSECPMLDTCRWTKTKINTSTTTMMPAITRAKDKNSKNCALARTTPNLPYDSAANLFCRATPNTDSLFWIKRTPRSLYSHCLKCSMTLIERSRVLLRYEHLFFCRVWDSRELDAQGFIRIR